MGSEQSKGRGPRESVGSPASGELVPPAVHEPTRREEFGEVLHAPGDIDPSVQQAAHALLASGALLPGHGCYLIVYDKLRFPSATMARVVDYLCTMDIRVLLLACRGDVAGALKVIPTEELNP